MFGFKSILLLVASSAFVTAMPNAPGAALADRATEIRDAAAVPAMIEVRDIDARQNTIPAVIRNYNNAVQPIFDQIDDAINSKERVTVSNLWLQVTSELNTLAANMLQLQIDKQDPKSILGGLSRDQIAQLCAAVVNTVVDKMQATVNFPGILRVDLFRNVFAGVCVAVVGVCRAVIAVAIGIKANIAHYLRGSVNALVSLNNRAEIRGYIIDALQGLLSN